MSTPQSKGVTKEPARRSAEPTTQGPPPARGRQRLLAGTGVDLVNAAERAICGSGAVFSASAAEGMALAGHRAAKLLNGSAGAPLVGPALTRPSRPLVYHRIEDGSDSADVGGFELVARSLQEAVDHCLAAHLIGKRSGQPGVCRIDRVLARRLGLAQVPGDAFVGEVLGPRSARHSGAKGGDLLAVVGEALAEVGRRSGRALPVVTVQHADDAELLVVCMGSASPSCAAAVERLRQAGHRVGVVSLTVRRPLPYAELDKVLRGAQQLAVVEPGPVNGVSEHSLTAAIGVLWTKRGRPISSLTRVPAGPSDAVDELAKRLAKLLSKSQSLALALPAGPRPARSQTLAVVPGGQWGLDLALDVATQLGRLRDLDLEATALGEDPAGALTIRFSSTSPSGAPSATAADRLDVLIVPHPALLEPRGLAAQLARAATVVLQARASSPEAVWRSLGSEARELLKDREAKLWWIDTARLAGGTEVQARAARSALVGAAVAALAGEEPWSTSGADPVQRVAAGLEAESLDETAIRASWLRRGAKDVTRLDPAALEATVASAELTFRAPSKLPRMPEPPGEAPQSDVSEATDDPWWQALRRFHLNGESQRGGGDPSLGLPLHAASLGDLADPAGLWSAYPIHLPPVVVEIGDEEGASGRPEPFAEVLARALEAAEAATPILEEHRLHLVSEVGRGIPARPEWVQDDAVARFAEASARFAEHFDVSDVGADALAAELEVARGELPTGGMLVGLGRHTALHLYLHAVERQRTPGLRAYLSDVRQLVNGLEDILRSDRTHDPEASTPEALSASLGVAEEFIDTSVLSATLSEHRGPRRLAPERRQRIEAVLATLRDLMADGQADGAYVVVHREPLPDGIAIPETLRVRHPDPFSAAVGLFDGLAERWSDVFKAVRVARLEVEGQYDPTLHDDLLAGFDWRSAAEGEVALLPRVVVIEEAGRVERHGLASYHQMLRSGRPIHGLVLDDRLGRGEWADALSDLESTMGQLAMAQGEALVVKSSLAQPGHLRDGLERMALATRPGVALVAVTRPEGPATRWLSTATAHTARATPCFTYDPDAGPSWAERFDLGGNPEAESAWPSRRVAYLSTADTEDELETAFTFADGIAHDAAFRGHFWVIPRAAWSDEDQIPLVDYLAKLASEPIRAVPYIWVVDEDGLLQRAVVTRELAGACFYRMRAWNSLQELGGYHNEFARRAAEEARKAAAEEAAEERSALEAAHAEALEKVRSEAAGEVVDRLVNVLMNLEAIPVTGAMPQVAAPAGPAPAVKEEAPPVEAEAPPAEAEAPEEEEEEEISFGEPYIDSFLCTTCNDCTLLNPLMFKYNNDKQAYIADPTAGTFEELVRAAEKCPASCIHPGEPRSGDESVTDDLIARAAKFN